LAILAAASTAALAKDLKQDNKTTTRAISAPQMTDSEMDKVTGAGITVINTASGREINGNAFRACGHGPIFCP
jgi:hypothetical protein